MSRIQTALPLKRITPDACRHARAGSVRTSCTKPARFCTKRPSDAGGFCRVCNAKKGGGAARKLTPCPRGQLEASAHGQPEGDRFQRMNMAVGDAIGRFAPQAVDIPELRRLSLGVEHVVEAGFEFPATFEIVADLAIPLAIAAGPDSIVGG